LIHAHPWGGNFRELANFAQQLPRAAEPASIDARACARILQRIALEPPRLPAETPPAGAAFDWSHLAAQAAEAFAQEHDNQARPASWDDVKEYVEKYLKPLLFAHLSGATALPDAASGDLQTMARALDADRGTAQKQLQRYFECFRKR
jgi:DNA-binding NtrC family response regulator